MPLVMGAVATIAVATAIMEDGGYRGWYEYRGRLLLRLRIVLDWWRRAVGVPRSEVGDQR
jgi:hypothetical protein